MTKAIRILLVEDNEGDILLAREALKEGDIMKEITVARDGEEALRILQQRTGVFLYNLPDIILLDINLPRLDGQKVLAEIKHDHNLKMIPVIMLTTSSSEIDIFNAYYHHANCYIVKPVDLEKFLQVVNRIESFWLSTVQLPFQN